MFAESLTIYISLTVRKLRVSVQEAYASRDVAISKATSLERELAQLRSEMASMRDSSVAHGRAMERKLSEERRAKAQTQSEELDAEQKSKFRVSRGSNDLLRAGKRLNSWLDPTVLLIPT